MDKLKYIKLENEDGSYSQSIPLAVDAEYVDVNGKTLISELNNKATKDEVSALASGSPAGVYNTLQDLINANPDHSRIYIIIENGNWYYYDATVSNWVPGGIYQSYENSDTVNLLKNNFDDDLLNKKNILECNKKLIHTIPFEQGRWIQDENTHIIMKEIGASENVTNIRIRSDKILKFSNNVKIVATDNYQFEIYLLDENNIVQSWVSWDSAYTILANQRFILNMREINNNNIYAIDINDYLEVSEVNQMYLNKINGIRFTSGNYNYTSWKKPVYFNQGSAATKIRLTSENIINKPFRLKIKDGYSASFITRLYDGTLGPVLNSLQNTIIDVKLKNLSLNIQKIDNTSINPEEYNDAIDIQFYDGFTFEQGGTNIDENKKYVQNNSDAGITLRIRTNPTYIDKPFKIKAKDGYSFTLEKYDDNDIRIEQISSGDTLWLKEYVCPQGRWCIAVKNDNGNNIYSVYVNESIEINYDINKYKEKSNYNVLFIGDSITEVNYTAECNWTKQVYAQFNFNSIKYMASGGTGIIAGGNSGGWYYRLDTLDDTQYDLILIMGNMNDYSNNIFNASSLGSFGDNTLSTEYGALKLFIEKLINKYPLAKIGWITSTPRQYREADSDNSNPIINDGYLWGNNSVFENANKAIIETCNNYSIPVLDLFHNSNFKVWSEDFKKEYFYDSINSVHPNTKGNEIIAIKIADFIDRNF